MGKSQSSSTKTRDKTGSSLPPLLFGIVSEVSASVIRQEKGVKRIPVENEIHLYLQMMGFHTKETQKAPESSGN